MADFYGQKVTQYYDDVPDAKADVSFSGGRVRVLRDAIAATDAAQNDRILLGRFPSNVVILPSSTVYHTAMGTSVTGDIGVINPSGKSGFTNDPDAIIADVDISAAGEFKINSAANEVLAQRLWEYTDATTDPQQDIDVFLTLADANPDSGTVSWEIYYTID